MDKNTFSAIFDTRYKTDEFLEPWSILLLEKKDSLIKFQVADYSPKLVLPGEKYPEIENISIYDLNNYKDRLKNFVISIDPNVKDIFVNEELI